MKEMSTAYAYADLKGTIARWIAESDARLVLATDMETFQYLNVRIKALNDVMRQMGGAS